jgi:hypothetical protein
MKQCTKCKEWKEDSQFPKRSGLLCDECNKRLSEEWEKIEVLEAAISYLKDNQ